MARPIPSALPARDPRAELRLRLDSAPAEHAEALLAAYEVLQGLHDRGALDLLRGMLGSGEKVLEIAVRAATTPQSIRSMRNLLLLVNMVGEIDPVQLKRITQAVPEALNGAGAAEPPSLGRLVAMIWNKNVRRAVGFFTGMLEALGKNLAKRTSEPVPTSRPL